MRLLAGLLAAAFVLAAASPVRAASRLDAERAAFDERVTAELRQRDAQAGQARAAGERAMTARVRYSLELSHGILLDR